VTSKEIEMASSVSPPPAQSPDQLAELLRLIADSDSVELKLTVPDSDHRSTIRSLGLDPLEAQIRQVFFFDTADLRANQAGVVARARRIQGKGSDSVIKLRPVVPSDLPKKLRKSASFNIEVDAMPGGFVCSGSLKGTPGKGEIEAVAAGEARIRRVFSDDQRSFFAKHAPDGLALDDLLVLGPIFVLKQRFFPQSPDRRWVAEMWVYPDGSRLLELSTKCAPAEAFQVAAESRAFLAGKGVDLTSDQETKTRKALDYFAKIISDAGEGRSE
jgi:hypothetical protein